MVWTKTRYGLWYCRVQEYNSAHYYISPDNINIGLSQGLAPFPAAI